MKLSQHSVWVHYGFQLESCNGTGWDVNMYICHLGFILGSKWKIMLTLGSCGVHIGKFISLRERPCDAD